MNLFFGLRKRNSGSIARNRLKLLLVSDKANCSAELMEMVKSDMIKSVSKYMEVDLAGVELQMRQIKTVGGRKTVPALCAMIPIREISKE